MNESDRATHAFFRYGAGDGRTLHLALRVDNDTRVVLIREKRRYIRASGLSETVINACLEIKDDTVTPPPGFTLTDNDSRHR